MTETDPRADERAFYDNTDYSELDLERADDVKVVHGPGPRSIFAPPQGPPASPPVTEAMRLEAINNLMRWQRQDVTVKYLVRAVLVNHSEPSLGHLARHLPLVFDELYEEASALTRNDL